ncbi:MAG TPA: hypothetical protein VMT54_20860 [Candidatus Cybelea sp.]|nr:hypothetical protein [Candidatus Cybelea sp.]
MRSIVFAILTLAATGLLGACGHTAKPAPAAQMASGEKVVITQGTWNAFINYKQWLMPKSYSAPVGEGYFAVTKDGRGWGLAGCPDNSCDMGSLHESDAINECSTRNGGAPCMIFAHQDQIVVPYEIAQ